MIYFTSDTHFNHKNIIDYADRPFRFENYPYAPDLNKMNEVLVKNWNDTVAPDDTVIFVGDWSMGNQEEGLKFRRRLNGTIVFVWGNHDACWPGGRVKNGVTPRDWYWKFVEAGFGLPLDRMQIPIAKDGISITTANVSHFPYVGNEHDARKFDGFRMQDDGRWLLHGHVHTEWKVRGRQINVGTDVWDYRPVSMDEIADIILAEGA